MSTDIHTFYLNDKSDLYCISQVLAQRVFVFCVCLILLNISAKVSVSNYMSIFVCLDPVVRSQHVANVRSRGK